jgi:hypothetical protein
MTVNKSQSADQCPVLELITQLILSHKKREGRKLFLSFLMTVFSQTFFAFVSGNLMTFSFFTAGHVNEFIWLIIIAMS